MLGRISHKISSEVGQDVATDSSSHARGHCQDDKARAYGGEDGVTDCSNSPRVCEKCGLIAESLSFCIDKKYLIKNINLTFSQGILYGILGPNGSGKSTLLKSLTGIWRPTSGKVLWNGEELLKKSRSEISSTISLVPQNTQVDFDFSITEMVEMGRYPTGSPRKGQSNELLEWALKTVDAWHLKDRSISRLSYGERKRVYIARALITESPILLLDEPTSSLDIRHQLEIWQLLRKLVQQGKTIIVTTHDLVATERFCDEIAILNQGVCRIKGPYNEVFTDDLLCEVFGVQEDPTLQAKHYNVF